ncbi:hypothetical protein FA13DRAFT_1777088, partial [Coprinellus micaceus]
MTCEFPCNSDTNRDSDNCDSSFGPGWEMFYARQARILIMDTQCDNITAHLPLIRSLWARTSHEVKELYWDDEAGRMALARRSWNSPIPTMRGVETQGKLREMRERWGETSGEGREGEKVRTREPNERLRVYKTDPDMGNDHGAHASCGARRLSSGCRCVPPDSVVGDVCAHARRHPHSGIILYAAHLFQSDSDAMQPDDMFWRKIHCYWVRERGDVREFWEDMARDRMAHKKGIRVISVIPSSQAALSRTVGRTIYSTSNDPTYSRNCSPSADDVNMELSPSPENEFTHLFDTSPEALNAQFGSLRVHGVSKLLTVLPLTFRIYRCALRFPSADLWGPLLPASLEGPVGPLPDDHHLAVPFAESLILGRDHLRNFEVWLDVWPPCCTASCDPSARTGTDGRTGTAVSSVLDHPDGDDPDGGVIRQIKRYLYSAKQLVSQKNQY